MKVRLKLRACELPSEGDGVADQMQRTDSPIDDAGAGHVGDPCLTDCPLGGDGPVEGDRAGGNLVHGQVGEEFPKVGQRSPHPFAGEAAGNRQEIADPAVHGLADGHEAILMTEGR